MARRFLTAFLITTLISGGYFYYLKNNSEQIASAKTANNMETAAGETITATTPFELTDQNGKKVTEKDLAGKKLLVFFGFTSCPDVCPVSMAVLTEVMNQLQDTKVKNVQPVFITVDPQTDTPEVLKKYLKDYYPSFIALTGPQTELDKVKQSFRVYAESSATGPQESAPNHSNLIYYMDEKGKYIAHFTGEGSAEDIVDYISSH